MATNNFITTGLTSATGTAPPGALTKTDNPSAAAVPTQYAWNAAAIQPTLGALADISTYLNNVIDLQSYGADPTGVADCHTALVNAYTAALAGNGVVQIRAGTFKLGTNTTVPAGVTLLFTGGVFSIANGVTLTITHSIQAAPTAQIFSFSASPSATPVAYSVGPVSPMWWGAKGDGSTDDTAAIKQCFAGCGNLEVSPPDMDDVEFVVPEIHFPARQFNVSTVLELPFGAFVTGEGGSCLFGTSSSNDVLTSTGSYFRARVDGLSVIGGQNGLTITGNDLDMDTIYVARCAFSGQSAYAFNLNRLSTQLVVDQCNLRNANAAGGIITGGCDEITLIDCWVSTSCSNTFNLTGADISMIRITGVSGTTGGVWINVNGAPGVYIYQCRFGGEAGGQTLVKWAGSTVTYPLAGGINNAYLPGLLGGALVIEDSNCFSFGAPILNFQDLPAQLRLVNNQGFSDSTGIHFDSAIPPAARVALGYGYYTGLDHSLGGNASNVSTGASISTDSDPEVVDRVLFAKEKPQGSTANPKAADLQANVTYGAYSTEDTSSNVTISATTNEFGTAVQQGVATAVGGSWTLLNNNFFSGYTAGPYTTVFDIEVNGGVANASFLVGEGATGLTLRQGRNLVHVPHYIRSVNVTPSTWAATTSYSAGNIVKSGAGGTSAPEARWECVLGGTSAGSGGPGSTSGSDAPGYVIDGPSATLVAGSSGSTLNVSSSASFAASGSVWVQTSLGFQSVAYTGKGTGTLTGCTGLTGTPVTGGAGFQGVMWVWIGNLSLGISFTLTNGATVLVGPTRVFAGRPGINTRNTKLHDTAAPAAGSVGYFVGDVVENDAPAAAGVFGWVCTAAGTPGTWNAFGQISA